MSDGGAAITARPPDRWCGVRPSPGHVTTDTLTFSPPGWHKGRQADRYHTKIEHVRKAHIETHKTDRQRKIDGRMSLGISQLFSGRYWVIAKYILLVFGELKPFRPIQAVAEQCDVR